MPAIDTEFNREAARFENDVRKHRLDMEVAHPTAVEALVTVLRDDGGDAVTRILDALMPARVDGQAWLAWMQGGALPRPVSLALKDGDNTNVASARNKALARVRDAQDEVDRCRDRLQVATDKLNERARDIDAVDDRMRNLTIGLVAQEMTRRTDPALRMGPLYTLARAVSPYLQVDLAWEAGLTKERLADPGRRREARGAEATETLDLLDRYAGDERLELNLQRAILMTLREHHQQFIDDIASRREAGQKSTEQMKRRAVRRRTDEMTDSVHPAAPLADASDVFDAFDAFANGTDGDGVNLSPAVLGHGKPSPVPSRADHVSPDRTDRAPVFRAPRTPQIAVRTSYSPVRTPRAYLLGHIIMANHQDITYDDVRLAVDEIVADGTVVDAITLRQIRAALGDRGSFATISRHLATIKESIATGNASEDREVTDADILAVRKIIEDIVTRRTFHHRRETVTARMDAAEEIRLGEIANANQRDVVIDLEAQNDALRETLAAKALELDGLVMTISRLEGHIEALNATLVTFAAAAAHHADPPAPPGEPPPRRVGRGEKSKAPADPEDQSQTVLPLPNNGNVEAG